MRGFRCSSSSLFQQLNHIIEQLEQEEISLEDSFRLYQTGMKLIKTCNASIDKVEKKIIVLEKEDVE